MENCLEPQIGDVIRIIKMDDDNGNDFVASKMAGKTGVIEYIDGKGQLHGSWGSLAIIPEVDEFEIIESTSDNSEVLESKQINEAVSNKAIIALRIIDRYYEENGPRDVNKVFADLSDQLMPNDGKADTVAGEVCRAVSRIVYRFYNDGDIAGEEYGVETVNPAVRYISSISYIDKDSAFAKMAHIFMLYVEGKHVNSEVYEEGLFDLEDAAIRFIKDNNLINEPNHEDMWDFATNADKFDEYEEEYDEYEDEWDDMNESKKVKKRKKSKKKSSKKASNTWYGCAPLPIGPGPMPHHGRGFDPGCGPSPMPPTPPSMGHFGMPTC